MKQIQIATYFLIFIHFLRMIFRRTHSEKQCKHSCPNTWCSSDSSCPLALYYRMRENGKLNLYALVFYLDDEGIRTNLLRLLMSVFDDYYIHYLTAEANPASFFDRAQIFHNISKANAPILDITKWLALVQEVQNNFFNDPKNGNFRYEDFFIERIEE